MNYRTSTRIFSGCPNNKKQKFKDSPAFHSLTGAIAAYDKALAILTALQAREECYSIIAQYELSEQSERQLNSKHHKGDQFWQSTKTPYDSLSV